MNSLLILGEQHTFSKLELELLKKKFLTFDFIKYNEVEPAEVIQQITSIIEKKTKSLIVLNTKALVTNELLIYLTKLEQEEIKYISIQNFMEKHLYKCYIPNELSDITFLEKIRPFSTFQYIQKRSIDYLVSIILLLLTFPLIIYSVYRIKKDSNGAIFFKQQRIGIHGKKFTCIKFRSMYLNNLHNPYTEKNDKRIFPWGKTMRKLRIDELPQIFNVLKGDMHLIGPRAEWDILVDKYEKKIPYYHKRHIVRPGITGWAQVNYPYGVNTEDSKQKLMYDLFYIKHWSIIVELKIIWKTILVILTRKGV